MLFNWSWAKYLLAKSVMLKNTNNASKQSSNSTVVTDGRLPPRLTLPLMCTKLIEVDRLWSGVRVSASFHIFALRILLWECMLVLRALTRLNSRFVPFSLKPDGTTAQTTPQTTAQPNCHRRACMYDWTTVRQDDHAFSECPLLQVFKNALFVSRLGSGPRFWLRIAPHTVARFTSNYTCIWYLVGNSCQNVGYTLYAIRCTPTD